MRNHIKLVPVKKITCHEAKWLNTLKHSKLQDTNKILKCDDALTQFY